LTARPQKLTEQEKVQARGNEVLQHAAKYSGIYENSVVADMLLQMQKLIIQKQVMEPLMGAVSSFLGGLLPAAVTAAPASA
jgi:hypothetical protein